MAALIKRSGYWNIKYRDASGKQIWRKGYTDKQETRDLANKLEREVHAVRSGHVDPIEANEQSQRHRTASDLINAYDQHLTAAGRSANHISYTIADVRKCFAFTAVKYAGQMTKEHVDGWVISLGDLDAARTINRRIGSVQAFLSWCQEKGAVSKYVLLKYPKRNVKGTEKRKCRHLTAAEVTKLLKGTSDHERKDVYKFALLTGLRFSELASMRPESFNLKSLQLTVAANDAKNKKKSQTIPLHPDLVAMVSKRIKGKASDERIFALPPRTDAAKLLRSDCEGAKIDPGKVMFHSLRHTFVTRLAENMVHPKIAQKLARHANMETTMSYYTHFQQADDVAAMAMLKAG